jgi:Flp pilus assembly protein TadD
VLLSALAFPSTSAWSQGASNGDNEPTPNRGWEGLARVLDMITPSVDTLDPPSGTEINDRISGLLNRNQAQKALDEITAREAQLASSGAPSADVQLMFQKARALAQLGQFNDARSVYNEMTIRFPELAEPWNNLGVLYISQGSLDLARQAFETAINNNPAYPAARSNLADLQLLLALREYQDAAKLGSAKARKRAQDLEAFIGSLN